MKLQYCKWILISTAKVQQQTTPGSVTENPVRDACSIRLSNTPTSDSHRTALQIHIEYIVCTTKPGYRKDMKSPITVKLLSSAIFSTGKTIIYPWQYSAK